MSSPDTQKLKEVARRLRAAETTAKAPAAAKISPTFGVCERLRLPLSRLLGTDGFRALLLRAQNLGAAQVPWLRTLHVSADGTVEVSGADERGTKPDAAALAEAELVLVIELLGLLVTFIGPALTLRLLHDIWPRLDDLNF